jgi:hypothetical protein
MISPWGDFRERLEDGSPDRAAPWVDGPARDFGCARAIGLEDAGGSVQYSSGTDGWRNVAYA